MSLDLTNSKILMASANFKFMWVLSLIVYTFHQKLIMGLKRATRAQSVESSIFVKDHFLKKSEHSGGSSITRMKQFSSYFISLLFIFKT